MKRPDSELSLPVIADATGSMDDYTLAAHIEGDLWQHMQSIGDCIKLSSTSTVPGQAPLTPDDIYSRLIGVSDVLAALKNQNAGLTPWAPLAQKGVTNLAVPKFSELLRGKFFGQVLDTLSYDPWHHDF